MTNNTDNASATEPEDPVWGQETLAQYLARAGRLPVLQGLALAVQLLAGLGTLHQRGTAHGDISIASLRVSRTGRLMLPPPNGSSTEGALEQHRHEDPSTDLAAAAVVVYALLTGSPISAGAAPPSVRASRAELPSELDAVFARALASRPGDRFRSAAEFAQALQAKLPAPDWDRTMPASHSARAQARVPAPPASAGLTEPGVARVRAGGPMRAGRIRWHGLALASGTAAICIAAALWTELRPAPFSTVHEDQAPAPLQVTQAQQPIQQAERPELARVAPRPDSKVDHEAPLEETEGFAQAVPSVPIAAHDQRRAAPAQRETSSAGSSAQTREGGFGVRRAAQSRRPTQPTMKKVAHLPPPSPDAACQNFPFAPSLCTAFRCATTEFRRHPVCVRMHAEADRTRARLAEARGGP
jgi:eukaryotic-like serine/threonine-protein kinase